MGLLANAAATAAIIFCSVSSPAQAQGPRQIEILSKAAFKHRHSKIGLPPVLAGLPRTKIVEYEADQLDTMSEYATPELTEGYTVYIYRDVAGGVPVWFDRARWMLERRAALGTSTLHAAGAFVPPGRASASGLIATYAATGTAYRSSGVALIPIGEWLVKMRASSQSLSPAELEARMKAALGEIAWPKKMPPAPAAAPVTACATPLALSGEAKPVESDDETGAATLMGALLGQVGTSQAPPKRRIPPPATRWCRDSTEMPEAGVYRTDERADSYLLAIGDAGRGAIAGPSAGASLLEATDEKKGSAKRFEVQTILLSQTTISGLLDRLPPPAQALAIAKNGPYASSFATWGKGKGQISVNSDMMK